MEEQAAKTVSYRWTPLRCFLAFALVGGVLGPLSYLVYYLGADLAGGDVAGGSIGRMSLRSPRSPFNLENLKIPRDQMRSGGPAKDGIPSLTRPPTVPVAKADFMQPTDRVVVVKIGDERRAYPMRILNWHEAVNDELGGVPIGVIYCPLCDSASVVDRRMGDRTYEFGISGLLFNSNVLLYDRTDQALWSQLGLEAVSGPNAGRKLRHVNSWELTTFADLRERYPGADILSRDTGHRRDYDRVAYASYFLTDRLMFPVAGNPSERYAKYGFLNKTVVVGVLSGGVARAYALSELDRAGGTVTDTIGNHQIELILTPDKRGFRVLKVPPDARVVHTFWFAWAAFHPETEVYQAGAGGGKREERREKREESEEGGAGGMDRKKVRGSRDEGVF